MMRAMRIAIAFLLLTIGAATARAEDAAPQGKPLDESLGEPITDPAEITGRMAGNTLSGVLLETGTPWTEYYCDTGRSLYEFGDIARGKWWTKAGKVCFSYEYDDYQHPACFEMFSKAGGYLVFLGHDDTGQAMTFLSRPPVHGDPLHLEERAQHGCALGPSV